MRRALALLGWPDQQDPQRLGKPEDTLKLHWRLSDVRERILDLQGRRAEQRTVIDEMYALANALDDDGRRAYAAFRLSGIAQFTESISVSASAARQAMILAERAGDDSLRLTAMARLTYSMAVQRECEPAKALAHTKADPAQC